MPSASAPFKAKTPFHSRVLGVDNYSSFGVDFINPPFHFAFGCLSRSPNGPFNPSGLEGGPFSPAEVTYTVVNTGGATITWNVVLSDTWMVTDTPGGILEPGESQQVTVSLDADSLSHSPTPYHGLITWTNVTNGCGNSTNIVNLSVTEVVNLVLKYRIAGGLAFLVGVPEYSTPSSPPKKYRTETITGDVCSLDRGKTSHVSCSGDTDNVSRRVWSGAAVYSQLTGALTNNQQCLFHNTGSPSADCTGIVVTTPELVAFPFVPRSFGCPLLFVYSSVSPTDQLWSGDSFYCCDVVPSDPSSVYRQLFGDVSSSLSNEDTNADAIARVISTGYGGYATAFAKGDARSKYQTRVTGFTFTYVQTEYSLTASGLTPSTLYHGTVTISRRLYGTFGPWLFVSTDAISGTTDAFGTFLYGPVSLPQVSGYEYTVWDASLSP